MNKSAKKMGVRRNTLHQQKGMNLIELMIALTISLIVLAGASVILANSQKSSRIQDNLIGLQENARFAIAQISRDLQLSGYYGCVQDLDPSDAAGPVISNLSGNIYISSPVRGYEDSATPESTLTAPNRDVLEIQYARPILGAKLAASMTSPLSDLVLDDASNIQEQDVLLIANCEVGDIFTVSGVSGNTIQHQTDTTSGGDLPDDYENISDSLSAVYPKESYLGTVTQLYEFGRIKYFIEPAADPTDPDTFPTLRRVVNAGINENGAVADEFIPGVEAFEVLYGEDTDGDVVPDTFVNANSVGVWGNISAVRFALLLRTEDQFGTDLDRNDRDSDGGTIDVLGTDFTLGDARVRRRVFQTTVYIRNAI